MTKGIFITLEGIEGVGKSTHVQYIKDLLTANGQQVRVTREPGGTETGEAIRELLLHSKDIKISDLTELTLIFAARAQHLEEVIRPALADNEIVICDRFTDATYAYQGGGRGIAQEKIQILETLVQGELRPDLTLLFDASVITGLSRAKDRSEADRFEKETVLFFEKIRSTYLEIATAEPGRVVVIDAEQSIEKVQIDILTELKDKGIC